MEILKFSKSVSFSICELATGKRVSFALVTQGQHAHLLTMKSGYLDCFFYHGPGSWKGHARFKVHAGRLADAQSSQFLRIQ